MILTLSVLIINRVMENSQVSLRKRRFFSKIVHNYSRKLRISTKSGQFRPTTFTQRGSEKRPSRRLDIRNPRGADTTRYRGRIATDSSEIVRPADDALRAGSAGVAEHFPGLTVIRELLEVFDGDHSVTLENRPDSDCVADDVVDNEISVMGELSKCLLRELGEPLAEVWKLPQALSRLDEGVCEQNRCAGIVSGDEGLDLEQAVARGCRPNEVHYLPRLLRDRSRS